MYCERCHRILEGDVCPECGKKAKREVTAEDSCLLLSVGQIWADMACDVLDQEKIPYLKQGSIGAAMAMLTGMATETYQIYVPYSYYDKAKEIIDPLFEPADETDAEDAETEEAESEEE